MSNLAMRGNPAQLVQFKRDGNQKLAKELPDACFSELRSLIVASGHHGLFKLFVRGSVHDPVCPMGLHIKEALRTGVMITWNNSRNPRNGIEISLTEALPGVSGDRFFADLRAAQKKLDEEDGSDEDVAQATPTPARSDNVVDLRPAHDANLEKPSPSATESPRATTVRFSENRAVVTELFMEEAAKVADPRGWLPAFCAFRILRDIVTAPGPTIDAMLCSGDLIGNGKKFPDSRHRMSDEWLKKFHPSQASDSQQTPVEAPIPAPQSQERAAASRPLSANPALNTERFFAEAVKIADADGVIYARAATEILVAMGRARRAASSLYRGMVRNGDLHRLPNESRDVSRFRIDEKWLAKFRSPQRDEARKAIVEQPSSKAPESDSLAFVKKAQTAITELPGLRAQEKNLQGLKETALKEVSRLAGQLTHIRGKIEEYSKLEAALRTLQSF